MSTFSPARPAGLRRSSWKGTRKVTRPRPTAMTTMTVRSRSAKKL